MLSKEYKETTGLPNFILILFVIQFLFFVIYTINNREDKSLIYYSIGTLILGALLFFIKLTIKINNQYFEYKMIPFVNRKILFKDIKAIKVIKISAISDYLGWGIRYSKKYGWGYITKSDFAIFIEKNNGKKLTFSIKDKDRLNQFLKNLSYPK